MTPRAIWKWLVRLLGGSVGPTMGAHLRPRSDLDRIFAQHPSYHIDESLPAKVSDFGKPKNMRSLPLPDGELPTDV